MEVRIPTPPPELFVREKRTATTGEQAPIYMLDKIDCVPLQGVLVYRTGATYPEKGWPTPEALYSLNQIKRMILEFMGLCKNPFILLGLLVTDKNTLMRRFNVVFEKVFELHVLKEEFMCPAARAFNNFVFAVLKDLGFEEEVSKKFAFYIAQILEYDNAYRYRVQDVMTALDLNNSLSKEVRRLIELWASREEGFVHVKMKQIVTPLTYLLYVPKYRRAISKNLHILKDMKYDDADWYWCCMRSDYKYGGISWEDRQIGIVRPQMFYATT